MFLLSAKSAARDADKIPRHPMLFAVLPIIADQRHFFVDVGAEVAEADEGFAAGVFDFDAGGGGFVGDEDFVLGFLAEADHGGGLEGEFANAAFALNGDPAAGAGVFDRAFRTGIRRRRSRANELFARWGRSSRIIV